MRQRPSLATLSRPTATSILAFSTLFYIMEILIQFRLSIDFKLSLRATLANLIEGDTEENGERHEVLWSGTKKLFLLGPPFCPWVGRDSCKPHHPLLEMNYLCLYSKKNTGCAL